MITWIAIDRRQAQMSRAERKRQNRQLSHDRALDDREALRTFLDEVTGAYEDLHHGYTQLIVVLRQGPEVSAEALPRPQEMADTAHKEVTEGLLAMGRRLSLCFPHEHTLLESVKTATGEL